MQIIKDQKIVDDRWTRVLPDEETDPEDVELKPGPLLVSLAVWKARRDELVERDDDAGVLLRADELLDELLDDLEHLALIALDFPYFRDGRSYSKARLLRERHEFDGEIRAVGDVHHDQLTFMHRCGFDAYEPAEFFDLQDALDAFDKYSVKYQPDVHEKNPLFRRAKR